MDEITRAVVLNIQTETLASIEIMATTTVGITDDYRIDRIKHYLKECSERVAAVTSVSL